MFFVLKKGLFCLTLCDMGRGSGGEIDLHFFKQLLLTNGSTEVAEISKKIELFTTSDPRQIFILPSCENRLVLS